MRQLHCWMPDAQAVELSQFKTSQLTFFFFLRTLAENTRQGDQINLEDANRWVRDKESHHRKAQSKRHQAKMTAVLRDVRNQII